MSTCSEQTRRAVAPFFLRCSRMVCILLALGAASLSFAPELAWPSEEGTLTEDQVKAAFTFRFLGYVEWPAGRFAKPDSPVIVGIIGSDEIFDIESRIAASRLLGNHSIVVRKLTPDDPLTDVHAIFLASADAQKLPSIVARAQKGSVLLVSDAEGALGSGAEIVLTKIEGKVRFMVDLEAATRANLKVGSGMLSVAVKVLGSP